MMMIAFITIKSSLVPLIEGLCVLMSSGIQAEERWWDEAEFSIHRRQSGRIEQTKFIVQANTKHNFEGAVCSNGF